MYPYHIIYIYSTFSGESQNPGASPLRPRTLSVKTFAGSQEPPRKSPGSLTTFSSWALSVLRREGPSARPEGGLPDSGFPASGTKGRRPAGPSRRAALQSCHCRCPVIAGFLPGGLVQHVDGIAALQVEPEVFLYLPLVAEVELEEAVVGGELGAVAAIALAPTALPCTALPRAAA